MRVGLPKKRKAYLALVVLISVIGLGLKVVRYSGNDVASLDEARARVGAFLARADWVAKGDLVWRNGNMYPYQLFTRTGCPRPMAVAFLAGNSENAELVRRDANDDVAFVQDGTVMAMPSGVERQLTIITAGISKLLGRRSLHRLPVLAVTPRPPETEDRCSGPLASAWRDIEANR
ncbi:MAG: hypothetical protein ACK5JT_19055 [Hyphomicrobiaceae bacterium]